MKRCTICAADWRLTRPKATGPERLYLKHLATFSTTRKTILLSKSSFFFFFANQMHDLHVSIPFGFHFSRCYWYKRQGLVGSPGHGHATLLQWKSRISLNMLIRCAKEQKKRLQKRVVSSTHSWHCDLMSAASAFPVSLVSSFCDRAKIATTSIHTYKVGGRGSHFVDSSRHAAH